MRTTEKTNSIQKTARLAGVLYLILAVASGWAFMNISTLVVPGDAATTVSNLRQSEALFRLGILSDLFGQVVFIFLVLALYKLFKPVHKNQARLMVIFVVISVVLQSISLLNQIAALIVLNGADYLTVFSTAQLDALVLFFLNLHKAGFSVIAQIYFGLWLFPLGFLVYKSGFLPKIVGMLLIIAGVGYLFDVAAFFMLPTLEVTVSGFTFIGELVLLLWLLIKGVNVEQWQMKTLEPARI
ncbi:MAG: DUF4386 domain-containing protein [Chloroflexi bacterium]|nr:MAG: DUF4386 domain-containing protein [Chloroflexota bacterium]